MWIVSQKQWGTVVAFGKSERSTYTPASPTTEEEVQDEARKEGELWLLIIFDQVDYIVFSAMWNHEQSAAWCQWIVEQPSRTGR